jgi:catechol 2,3-dioxygenase-like lactoylglutathione lyase family enzyme
MSSTVLEKPAAVTGPVMPSGLNHLVINVRDMARSHRFWTEIIGLRQVGEFRHPPGSPRRGTMRFYSGSEGRHHDIALVETPELPPMPADGSLPTPISHMAFALPDRESWLRQLAFLQEKGVPFERRIEHGVTHSVYIRDPDGYGVELLYELPREVWEGDLDEALNYYVMLPPEGADALKDEAENIPVFKRAHTTG